jgi:hypothetical protein
MKDRKLLLLFVILLACVFLPTIASKPFPQEDTPLVIRDVITQTTYLWLSPAVHIAWIMLLVALYLFGKRIGRIADGFFTILFLFFAVGQNIAVTENYGLAVVTGNLVIILVVALFWIWELFKPRNEYVFERISLWRYWVVPFAILAFWFPMNLDASPNFSPSLLLTSGFGVMFCPTAPVVIAILTLIYPKVNERLLSVTSYVSLLVGLFNALAFFVMSGYTFYVLVLHVPLICIPIYGLLMPTLVKRQLQTVDVEGV